jgi:CheY-like chemotaxis protein
MPPEVKARIFEPFFTTRKVEGGTGMGLATVHGIVKRLGGAIAVKSAPGEGSTFTLYFPEHRATGAAERAAEGAGPRGTERILFVDDEPAVCRISTRSLSSLGYRVRSFTSAPAALAAFEAAPFDWDIVVTDTTMPELSGDALARKVKGLRPDLPVILCTGFSERVSEEEARTLGIDRFLLKPVVGAELSRVIRAVLEQART